MTGLSRALLWRIILLSVGIFSVCWLAINEKYELAVVAGLFTIWFAHMIFSLLININRKLTRFFEAIEFSDFAIKYSSDNKMGKSYRELNTQMNKVVEAFKQARAEKEANIHFLNAMVQHVNVGIICFDSRGKIEILNKSAIQLLKIYRIRDIKDLKKTDHAELYDKILELESGERSMYTSANGLELAINVSLINLRGKSVKIIAIQNIRSELQQKELFAWQNLTKVLRHEIMNSIAPIVSLITTMKSIVNEDLVGKAPQEPVEDLSEALQTIESRGKGVMNFVNAYRDFTSLPTPLFTETTASNLLKNLEPLMRVYEMEIKVNIINDFTVSCDLSQLEMVIINLVKNAYESMEHLEEKSIEITVNKLNDSRTILIRDYGKGIVPEALEKIFIPFFTTKKTGQGIGLSLSKQIMYMHRGDLTVISELDKGTIFKIEFM
ncbi:Histidine kinase-, DNA gyrase B-, and HSP90-like ATPase [Spirosomataceae bacterium TFI 002]|nr:Histidine kinase-, DNA gyrase B-, and HSP90-like ATPase [Spirosomataceae bacterium TFI 002]